MQESLAPMQQAIRCVTHAHILQVDGRRDGTSMLTVARWADLDQRDGIALRLSIQHSYRVTDGVVRTTRYAYDIDFDGELIQFHWHPGVGVDYPHINLRQVPRASRLMDRHIPTARVSIERVVRFLITELGAVPVIPGWSAILDRNEAEFVQRCSWWSTPPTG